MLGSAAQALATHSSASQEHLWHDSWLCCTGLPWGLGSHMSIPVDGQIWTCPEEGLLRMAEMPHAGPCRCQELAIMRKIRLSERRQVALADQQVGLDCLDDLIPGHGLPGRRDRAVHRHRPCARSGHLRVGLPRPSHPRPPSQQHHLQVISAASWSGCCMLPITLQIYSCWGGPSLSV